MFPTGCAWVLTKRGTDANWLFLCAALMINWQPVQGAREAGLDSSRVKMDGWWIETVHYSHGLSHALTAITLHLHLTPVGGDKKQQLQFFECGRVM